jgi:hypothetical protein
MDRAKLRGWAHVIGSVASVIFAAAAFVTALKGNSTAQAAHDTATQTHEVVKTAYEEHDKAIVQNQQAVAVTHEELEALRTYVDQHQNVHEAIVTPKPSAGEGRVVVMSIGADAGPPKVAPLPPPAMSRPFNAL